MDLFIQEIALATHIMSAVSGLPQEITEEDLFCMAKNVFFEARGEDEAGRVAVAAVTLNRVQHADYPDTICGVVEQDRQFSWFSDGKSDLPRDWDAYQEAMLVGAWVIAGEIADPSDGATHYFAHDLVEPHWAGDLITVAVIGGHTFKRE